MANRGPRELRAWIVGAGPAPGPVDAEAADAEPTVFSLTAGERLRRSLLKAGVARIDWLAAAETPPACDGRCVVLRDDHFYHERIVTGLLAATDVVLYHAPDEGGAVGRRDARAVAACVDGSDLGAAFACVANLEAAPAEVDATPRWNAVSVLDVAPAYNPALRKTDPPFVYRASTEHLDEIENRIFTASYKGVTDLVTKWLFPVPARAVVRVLARRGVRPNTVTAVSYVLAALVTWLFAEGWFATGLALGWLMTFLDTVDGKLARCTLTSSRFGNVFDHALDLVHPPIWWAAWAAGLPGGLEGNALAMWIIVGGYLVGRLLEGVFTLAFGIEFFVWRRFDGFFRQVVARRNPNLILLSLGVLFARPATGYRAVAAWTLACIGVAAVRNVQAHLLARRGVPIQPWLEEAEPSLQS